MCRVGIPWAFWQGVLNPNFAETIVEENCRGAAPANLGTKSPSNFLQITHAAPAGRARTISGQALRAVTQIL